MTIVLAAFRFAAFLTLLVWVAMAILNLWMFQKTKAQGNLLMLIGAACLALSGAVWTFDTIPGEFMVLWMPFIGAVMLLLGFYFTAKPTVDTHLEAIRKKISDMTAEKKTGGESGGESGGETGSEGSGSDA